MADGRLNSNPKSTTGGGKEGSSGYILLDTLLSVFLAGIVLVASAGLFQVTAAKAVGIEKAVKEHINAKSSFDRGRSTLFLSSE